MAGFLLSRPPRVTAVVLIAALAAFSSKTRAKDRPDGDGQPAGREDEPAAAEIPAPIRFVHYNLKNWLVAERLTRSGKPQPQPAPKPEAEKAAIVRVLKDLQPDILGVCEMGTGDDLAELQQRLAQAGLRLPHRVLHAGADPVRHLALLSRFPLIVNEPPSHQTYELEGQPMPMQRGMLDATVAVGDYRLRLVGLHLKSRRDSAEGDQAAMRRHEALLVREHVDAILKADPQTNLLVYGDLNETRNEAAVRLLMGGQGTAGALRDLPLADAAGERWTFHWPEADVYERIDFALTSPGLWPEIEPQHSHISSLANWAAASDHRALLVAVTPWERSKRPSKRGGRHPEG